jgi:hypothetical protein
MFEVCSETSDMIEFPSSLTKAGPKLFVISSGNFTFQLTYKIISPCNFAWNYSRTLYDAWQSVDSIPMLHKLFAPFLNRFFRIAIQNILNCQLMKTEICVYLCLGNCVQFIFTKFLKESFPI